MELTIRWLHYCKAHDCVPHHLSILVFPYLHEVQDGDYQPRRSAREAEEAEQIRRCREILDQNGLGDCRLFVTEWNNSLSTRSWLNDSCFRASYVLDVINRTWGMADVMGIWMATDWCCSYYDTMNVANGGNGLLSKNSIRKPVYHALDFLNRMNARFLRRGSCYIATTSGPDLYLLCYNFKRYSYQFFKEQENEFELHPHLSVFGLVKEDFSGFIRGQPLFLAHSSSPPYRFGKFGLYFVIHLQNARYSIYFFR